MIDMNQGEHFDRIRRGLKSLDEVFNKDRINYRVLGSTLVASLNGKPHRTLGDIDILVNKEDFDDIVTKLKSLGYVLEKNAKWGVHWFEAVKPDSLGFTFLLIGKFHDDYFSCFFTKNIELRVSAEYLKPTKYSLFGNSFTGIPQRSIYEGLKISNLNPKRALDRKIVLDHFKGKIPAGKTLEESFEVYLFGKQIPFAYPFFSHIYNIFGGIRVLLGHKYEVWD